VTTRENESQRQAEWNKAEKIKTEGHRRDQLRGC
jgi:hypothetical protein